MLAPQTMKLQEPFFITIQIDRNSYRFSVTHLTLNNSFETFLLKRKSREIIIKSNRPLWRNKGIMKRQPDFTVAKGEVRSQYAMQVIVEELMKKLEGKK